MKQFTLTSLLLVAACSAFAQGLSKHKMLQKFVKSIDVDQVEGAQTNFKIKELSKKLFKVDVTVDLKADTNHPGWSTTITPGFTPDFHWSPHLTPTDKHIVSDHSFRAPALICSSADKILTIVPDLEAREKSQYRWFMDLDAPKNKLAIGISNYRVNGHILFHKTPVLLKKGIVPLSFYVMISDKKKDIANPWRKPLAFMWNKYGKPLAEKGEPLNGDITPYVKHTYNWAFNTWKDTVWQEFELNGKKVGAPTFIVTYSQSPNYPKPYFEYEFRSVWNQAWFNSLKSAQGVYRFARRTNDKELMKKALMTKELALSFPQKDGLFPGVIGTEMENVDIDGHKVRRSKGWGTRFFGNSDRNPYTKNPKKCPYHILDMSGTAYHMLVWYEDLEKDQRLLDYVAKYADKLVTLQDKDGFFPAWLDFETMKALPVLSQSPETSKSVTFLLKLAKITKNPKYKKAALKAMDAVSGEIVQTGRWEDFETYWSCARWWSDRVGQKIPRNNMYKQNNFSIFWTAEAFYHAYKATKNKKYLELGQRTLDELLMTQSLWQPSYMYVKVFGGFGVMNADGEWNDARQAVFAELIIRYGKLLKKKEYVDRGVAALKASFNMMYCPENEQTKKQWEKRYNFFNEKDYGFMMENYGHGGYASPHGGGIGTFTIYDWGNGNACEAYTRIIDRYGKEILNNK